MNKSLLRSLIIGVVCLNTDAVFAYSMEAYCNKVMSSPSKDWIAKQKVILDGIKQYSDCYQGKLDDTLRKLNDSGKGPLMGANGDFRDMQSALQAFTDAGLTAIQANDVHRAYVSLYQQQFRNYFYQAYQSPSKLPKATVEQVNVAKAIFENELNTLSQATDLRKLFNDFYNEATNLGMPTVEIYRHAAFVLQKPDSKITIPAPF